MTYEELKKANDEMQTIGITRLDKETNQKVTKQYAEVAQRVIAFRKVYPNGEILTDLISYDEGICTFKATVYDDNGKVIATGHAREKETASKINATSCLENCETSAVGRALAFCGFGSAMGIASAEEIKKADAEQARIEKLQKDTGHLAADLMTEAEDLGIDIERGAAYLKKTVKQMTNDDLAGLIERKKERLGR